MADTDRHAYALGECGKYTQTPAGRLPVPVNYVGAIVYT